MVPGGADDDGRNNGGRRLKTTAVLVIFAVSAALSVAALAAVAESRVYGSAVLERVGVALAASAQALSTVLIILIVICMATNGGVAPWLLQPSPLHEAPVDPRRPAEDPDRVDPDDGIDGYGLPAGPRGGPRIDDAELGLRRTRSMNDMLGQLAAADGVSSSWVRQEVADRRRAIEMEGR